MSNMNTKIRNSKTETTTTYSYEIVAVEKRDGVTVENVCYRGDKRETAEAVAHKVAENPSEFDNIFPVVAHFARNGARLVIRRITVTTTRSAEDIETIDSADAAK